MITQKMKIESSKIENFLSNKEPINLQPEPTYTSFSYFYSQAVSCLGTFDREAGRQTEF